MAGEIYLRIQLGFAKGGLSAAADSGAISIDLAGTTYAQFEQTIGSASEEPLLLGDVDSRSALIYIKNLDTTNYVEYRPDLGSGTVAAIIRAGQVALWRFPGTLTAPYFKANTAPVRIQVTLIPI